MLRAWFRIGRSYKYRMILSSRLAVISSCVLFASLPAAARADEKCIGGDVGPGFFLASPNCAYTIHGEASVTAGTKVPNETSDYAAVRFSAEAGVLFAVDGRGSLELGPVFSVAALTDVDTGDFAPELAQLIHMRRWFAGGFLTVEASVGPSLRRFPESVGLGFITTLGLGIWGVGGPVVVFDQAFGPERESRIMGGVRLTWGAALVGLACAAGGCK